MERKYYNVVGVMSGTSLDGIDFAYLKITIKPTYNAQIITAETQSYPDAWIKKLQAAVHYNARDLQELNKSYTQYLGEAIHQFIEKNKIPRDTLDAICSHGHTILHQPDQGYTLQIGNLPEIASIVKCKTVYDFRVQDVTLGGQGAPLVPIGDQLLFSTYDYCINLGGFANVSMQKENTRIAYDICAVNTVLNTYALQLGKAYDDGGAFAKAGTVNIPLLDDLNALSFFKKSPPKSLGIEWVQEHIFPIISNYKIPPKDVLATFTEHIAQQLANQIKENSAVLITGGGAYNTYLMERLQALKKCEVIVPDNVLVEYKEALIFGLLGVLKLEGKNNCLASVTGARKDHSSGVVIDYSY
ncbi:anhydro-N-acetylmuramic acid kinase [uncultured Dokdonia sp.]|uniref:anhydro-N-acetylmuramic acid kinase n=1 Tax=uncultured Dokdonia sp. TaxID=575653 RepID=UPI002639E3B3|nr:anhydro-N-acetylmuramic acid kinase [uncultured Dokdonia sp.]